MSHPDLIIAAKLAPEDPLRQLGRYALRMLNDKLSIPEPYDQKGWGDADYELLEEAVRLGIISEPGEQSC